MAADELHGNALRASVLSAALTVADLATSLAWYRAVLGLTVARTFERAGTTFAASLRAGAVPILLTQDDGAQGAGRPGGRAFRLRDPDGFRLVIAAG